MRRLRRPLPRKPQPTPASRRRRLRDLVPRRRRARELGLSGELITLPELAVHLHRHLVAQRVIPGDAADVDAKAADVADALREQPRWGRTIASLTLGTGAGPDLVYPDEARSPALDDLALVLEHFGVRSIGEPPMTRPPSVAGWTTNPNPVHCASCGRRVWEQQPRRGAVSLALQAALNTTGADRALLLRQVPTGRWVDDDGRDHDCDEDR